MNIRYQTRQAIRNHHQKAGIKMETKQKFKKYLRERTTQKKEEGGGPNESSNMRLKLQEQKM